MGVVAGVVLLMFGLPIFVMVIIGLFNPLPISRASLLDNFPRHSSLRIIALTYAAQYVTWIFFKWFKFFDYYFLIWLDLGLLFVNVFLTYFFFQDSYHRRYNPKGVKKFEFTEIIKLIFTSRPLMMILFAFVFAESGFYLLLDYFEYVPKAARYFSGASAATLMGIGIAILWSSIPHKSIVAVCYLLGAGVNLLVILNSLFFNADSDLSNLIAGMSTYALVGGLYLPMVVEMLIKLLGRDHKAVGASIAEFGDTIAAFVGPAINMVVAINAFSAAIILTVLYISAAITQRLAEKRFSMIKL